MKPFFCRCCNARRFTTDQKLPQGWISLVQTEHDSEQGFIRLGIFCSTECVGKWLPIIKQRYPKNLEVARARTA